MNGRDSVKSFQIDAESARLYWTYVSGTNIWEYDILARRILKHFTYPSIPSESELRVSFASRNIVYFTENLGNVVYRGTTDGRNLTKIHRAEEDAIPEILATPWTKSITKFFNPCQNHNCSHLCALSGPSRPSCVCDPNFGLSLDGATCVGKVNSLKEHSNVMLSKFREILPHTPTL